jgi:hypothetical protein
MKAATSIVHVGTENLLHSYARARILREATPL